MATSKLWIFAVVVSLLILKISADKGAEDEIFSPQGSDPTLKIELEQLKSKISFLEIKVQEKTRELESKDERISQMEKIIQEKSDGVAALKGEIESIQKKGNVAAEELVGKAHERAEELQKQVETLQKDIDMQNKIKDSWAARAREIEAKTKELTSKLESLQKINSEQKNRMRKTERALQLAEEEIMKAKLEAASRKNELTKVSGAWLPPWLATHSIQIQSYAAKYWSNYGKPVAERAIQKVSEKSVQAQKWAEPHIESAKQKWVPAVKEQWILLTAAVSPYIETTAAKTLEMYETSKATLTPHFVKVKENATPYLQEAKKISKPYIDQVATFAKPHVDRVRVALKPYTKKVIRSCRRVLKSGTKFHHQVQAAMQEKLKKYELTKPLATKELVWFMASAFLAFPLYVVYTLLAAIFRKKSRRPVKKPNTNHGHRRYKRRHADK